MAWLNVLTDGSLSNRELRAFNKLPIASNPDQKYPPGPGRSPTPRHRSIWDFDSGLSEKIRRACEIARRDGYCYIWIDSCCIDKTSSSELSEAINSMFSWYRDAQVCYSFLSDVPSHDDIKIEHAGFRRSRWFTRAWTPQELIAPRVVVFFSQEWEPLGTKDALADLVEDITHIDHAILTHKKGLTEESFAERMRWAAKREASRVEDEAYSLLGIFGITMPTLYGEGTHSFRRLQEEILQRIPDQGLFAWRSLCLPTPQEPGQMTINPRANTNDSDGSLLASSPHSFDLSCGRIIRASASLDLEVLKLPVEEYTHTPYGICTRLCLLPLNALNEELCVTGFDGVGSGGWYLAILGCQYFGHSEDGRGQILSRLCYLTHPKPNVEFLHVPDSIYLPVPSSGYSGAVVFTVPLGVLADTEALQLHTKVVYLPYPQPSAESCAATIRRPYRMQAITLHAGPSSPATVRIHHLRHMSYRARGQFPFPRSLQQLVQHPHTIHSQRIA